jgi:hypothetical protein
VCFANSGQGNAQMKSAHFQQTFVDQATLMGILNTFIIPAIRTNNPTLQEIALHCLGLTFLIDKVNLLSFV